MQYEFITFSGIDVLGSQSTYIDFKGFFGSRVRKFAKIAVFYGGIYSADASPQRAAFGVDYAFASSEPTSSWPQTQHIRTIERPPKWTVFLSLVGVAGFEPTTPCPPDKCATRLRYTPNTPIIPNFQKNCKGFYKRS